ncbi:unnamed protein product [Didymodactylos carnosus]|uniref:Uncharacterized protein n=1 Tax=Didymodactylos carnosus TaxID=1234261 RepID=A0A8S2M960_9BILA|nr:unnamed protein product [Didymodactylos carnosus]CAF3929565.1 unnamed protein product [Didymodactylos carnosus]
MPPPSKRSARCRNLNIKRYASDNRNESGIDLFDEDSYMEEGAEADKQPSNFTDKIGLDDLAALFDLCKSSSSTKYLSVLMYMTLRHVGLTWDACNVILRKMGGFNCETSHKWADLFISGDFEEFPREKRGGKRRIEFWDYFPDIELSAKQFTLDRCSQKSADFTAVHLEICNICLFCMLLEPFFIFFTVIDEVLTALNM